MTSLRALLDRLLGRSPEEQQPQTQMTDDEQYAAERRTELRDEQIQKRDSGEDDPDHIVDPKNL